MWNTKEEIGGKALLSVEIDELYRGPNPHTIEYFEHLYGPEGPLPPQLAEDLPFVVIRSSAEARFDFDGTRPHITSDEAPFGGQELLSLWRELYGEDKISAVEWWSDGFPDVGRKLLGEPFIAMVPFIFLVTPPGWSTLVDGHHRPGLDAILFT